LTRRLRARRVLFAVFEPHDVIRRPTGLCCLSDRGVLRFPIVLRQAVKSGSGFAPAPFYEPAISKETQGQEDQQRHPQDKVVNEHDAADQLKHRNTRWINSSCKPESESDRYRSSGHPRCGSLPGRVLEAGKHRQEGLSHFLACTCQAMRQAPVDFRLHPDDLLGA
jgi:hypothetical protein